MPEKTYKADQGKDFGSWGDPTSKFLYEDSTREILKQYPYRLDPSVSIADYGGGNGILRKIIPWITTIDHDPDKDPDICEDILEYEGSYDLVIMRYVLHYLSDLQILSLIRKMESRELLIQNFANHDLGWKYFNSENESKIFRTPGRILTLLQEFDPDVIYWKRYRVSEEFYRNRLNHPDPVSHDEIMMGIRIKLK